MAIFLSKCFSDMLTIFLLKFHFKTFLYTSVRSMYTIQLIFICMQTSVCYFYNFPSFSVLKSAIARTYGISTDIHRWLQTSADIHWCLQTSMDIHWYPRMSKKNPPNQTKLKSQYKSYIKICQLRQINISSVKVRFFCFHGFVLSVMS